MMVFRLGHFNLRIKGKDARCEDATAKCEGVKEKVQKNDTTTYIAALPLKIRTLAFAFLHFPRLFLIVIGALHRLRIILAIEIASAKKTKYYINIFND